MDLIPGADQGVFVLIVLTVRPENQQALIDTIRSAGDPAAVPGLRSISLLRSLDGTQVINHMHWASQQAYQEASASLPVIRNTRAGVQRLAESAATNIYAAVSLSSPTGGGRPGRRARAGPGGRSGRRRRRGAPRRSSGRARRG